CHGSTRVPGLQSMWVRVDALSDFPACSQSHRCDTRSFYGRSRRLVFWKTARLRRKNSKLKAANFSRSRELRLDRSRIIQWEGDELPYVARASIDSIQPGLSRCDDIILRIGRELSRPPCTINGVNPAD